MLTVTGFAAVPFTIRFTITSPRPMSDRDKRTLT